MKFTEPKVEFVEFSLEDVIVTSGNKCTDSYTGGVFTCEGANMENVCGAKAASIG